LIRESFSRARFNARGTISLGLADDPHFNGSFVSIRSGLNGAVVMTATSLTLGPKREVTKNASTQSLLTRPKLLRALRIGQLTS
jgi:hypothetical protein